MNKVKINIWGREFELEVRYDWFEDEEELLPTQENAISKLFESSNVINQSLDYVKEYCLSNDKDKFQEDDIENIFKYVMPTYLYVMRTGADRTVAIVCDYRFDLEHGIAVVFKNEKFYQIGTQDIIV